LWFQASDRDHAVWQQLGDSRDASLVGDIPRGEDQRRFLAMQVGEFALQLDQRVAVAGDVAGATGAGAHAGGGFDHGADHLRMLAHAKVIVRAPNHDRARAVRGMPCRVRETTGHAFEIRKHAVAPFLVQPGKRGGKEIIIGHESKISVHVVFDDREFCRSKVPMPLRS
jgi:hypothetical protein